MNGTLKNAPLTLQSAATHSGDQGGSSPATVRPRKPSVSSLQWSKKSPTGRNPLATLLHGMGLNSVPSLPRAAPGRASSPPSAVGTCGHPHPRKKGATSGLARLDQARTRRGGGGGDNNTPPRPSPLAAPRLNGKAGREGRMRAPEGTSRASFLSAPPPSSLRGGEAFSPQRKKAGREEGGGGGKSGAARAQLLPRLAGVERATEATHRLRRAEVAAKGAARCSDKRCRRGSLSPGLSEVSEPASSLPPAAPSSVARGGDGERGSVPTEGVLLPGHREGEPGDRCKPGERGTAAPPPLSKVCAAWPPPFPRAVRGRAKGRRISSLSSSP